MRIYYMIRHKQAHTWLPYATQRNQTSATLTDAQPPRLFTTPTAAQNALRWWCAGESYQRWKNDDSTLETRPVPERQQEEMEIIAVMLQYVENRR